MRVAVLSWRDTSHPDGGGSEVYLEAVGHELVARGHQVTMVCARHPGARRRDRVGGMQVVRLGGRLTVYPRALMWLLTHGRRHDVVLDVVNGVPFASPLVRRRGVVALVHHLHQDQWRIIYPDWRGRFGWWVESRVVPRLYRGCRWLTVSEATRADLLGLGVPAAAVTVARNALTSTPVDGPRSETPRLVVLARLVPHKQIEHAFRVVAALVEELPELRLDVVGDGWWRERLVEEAERLGVAGRVTWHGHVGEETRDQLLRRAWLALLPSVKEGWGLAVTEAAAQGTPSLAYRSAGGVNESVLDGRTGALVDDLPGLVTATRRLLTSPTERERLGRAARRHASMLTWNSTADEVERVLAEAAGLRNRR
jgi:glycosyltransferase involved in cell wall biosynthesis